MAHRPVSSDIPMHHLRRAYDAYATRPVAEQAVASLSWSFLGDLPYQGHNILRSLELPSGHPERLHREPNLSAGHRLHRGDPTTDLRKPNLVMSPT